MRERTTGPRLTGALAAVFFFLFVFLGAPRVLGQARSGQLLTGTFHSAALEGNLLGDSADRQFSIYLPPGYRQAPSRRYPVVYLLHGYGSNHRQWAGDGKEWNIRDAADKLITAKSAREMIIVMPDGGNKYGGSFYTNSATNGNWEDYLTRDLIAHIDARYRTLPRAASRGIAGHSMGGYGAIKTGMKHPEMYGAVYGLSACCLGWGSDLASGNPAWDRALSLASPNEFTKADFLARAFLGLAAAWSPNPERGPLFVDWPFEGFAEARMPVAAAYHRWSANMPVWMVDQYRANLARLRAVAFDVGKQDEFAHIPANNRALSQALARNRIAHEFEEYEGRHGDKLAARVETKMLPFFSRVLQFQGEAKRAAPQSKVHPAGKRDAPAASPSLSRSRG